MVSRPNFRWLLPELDLADYERLKQSVRQVSQNTKLQRYYAFMARTPICYLTIVGGWSIKKSVLAYLLLGFGLLVPPSFPTMLGLFLITILSSYGQKPWKTTMIRLHIVRRFRTKAQNRVDVLSEPPLSLFAYLVRATGVRSLEEFSGTVRRARIVRRVISGAMISFLAVYCISIPFLFIHFWIPTPVWETLLAARVLTVSLYGMLAVVAMLIGTETIASFMLDSKRPVYVDLEELRQVTSN